MRRNWEVLVTGARRSILHKLHGWTLTEVDNWLQREAIRCGYPIDCSLTITEERT